jgi:electron transport complex protein RnfB
MDIIISIAVLGGLGLILGIIIGLCNRFLKVDEDDIINHVYELLPQINCGMCGNPSCKKMAEAIVEKDFNVELCKPCKVENRKNIEQILADFEKETETGEE